MGTNYYWHEKPPCEHCGQSIGERLHIGKSSAGWCFSLQVLPHEGINSFVDWLARFAVKDSRIVDEYGDTITPEAMVAIITERQWNGSHEHRTREFFESNHAERGPNGLLRHRVGPYCVGHGQGTWDLIPGEFS